jgi:pyruvate dehydrogenase E2 component (dihydrolipoamide acetyltransferase)
MASEIKMTMDGLLLNWLKDVGDSVKSGDVIAEFEADKATIEVEASVAGVLTELRLDVGEEAAEGDVIALIGDAGEAPAAATDTDGNSSSSQAEPQPAATTESAAQAQQPSGNGQRVAATTADGRVKASPLAKRVAQDKGVDLWQVSGSGPGGRIVKADVENFTPSAAPATPAPTSAPAPAASAQGIHIADDPAPMLKPTYGKLPANENEIDVQDVSRMRRAIANATINSKQMIPHFYVSMTMDVGPLLALRKQLNAALADEGIKISVNDMVVKATALTLRQYPNLNSHYYGDKIVRHKRINVGISVALPNNGLINVVSHDADKLSLSEMAVKHKAMFERAREGKVKPDDTRGATFTVSNLGPFNVDFFSAIINPPEAGIIAVGTAKPTPVVLQDGSFGTANLMTITISVDHRVSDGAEGAQWLDTLRHMIENPMRLLA